MSEIPSEINPLGVHEEQPSGEVEVYEDLLFGPVSDLSGDIPMPYHLNYEFYIDCDFPKKGTLRFTHVICYVDVLNEGSYVGRTTLIGDENILQNVPKSRFIQLSEEPVPVGDVVKAKLKLLDPKDTVRVACGPGYERSAWIDSGKPNASKAGQLAEYKLIGVNEDGEEIFQCVRSMAEIGSPYLNPLTGGIFEPLVTSAPDARQHIYCRAHMYPNHPLMYGAVYEFDPNGTPDI